MDEKWKYEKYIKNTVELIELNKDWVGDGEETLYDLLSYVLEKVFNMGKKSGNINSILTDLSNYPEVHDKIKSRWKEGVCN